MKRLILIGAMVTGVCVAPAQQLTGDGILSRIEEAWSAVNDYIVDLHVTIDMERVKVPDMKVTMYFKLPDKVHFESTSFAMLPREGLALNPKDLRRRFDAETEGRETVDGIHAYKLRLRAKSEQAAVRQMYLWVDPAHWTVIRFESVPAARRKLSVEFHYREWEGAYWLPDTLIASYEVLDADTTAGADAAQREAEMPIPRLRRPPRSGVMKVFYSNYRINTGLSDEIFERRQENN